MISRRVLLGCSCAGLGAVGAIAVVAAIVGYQVYRYRESVAQMSAPATRTLVVVSIPDGAASPRSGSPVLVRAEAFSLWNIASLELSANGEPVGKQIAPGGGSAPMGAQFLWIPSAPGPYALTARAVDTAGRATDSNALVVTIGPDDSPAVEEAGPPPVMTGGGGEGEPPGNLPPAPPLPDPPAPPVPDAPNGPAEPWQGSPLDWLSQFSASGVPAAPELTAQAQGCGALLSIRDLSSDEDGFFLYRQLPGLPQWQLVATLDGQSEFEYLTHADDGVPGPNLYRVEAFNSLGQASSNVAAAQVDPAACLPPGGLPLLNVKLAGLLFDNPPDKAYCYQSLGGANWTRVPASGFLLPGKDGFASMKLPLLSVFQEEQGKGGAQLILDCWGWLGDDLGPLGKFDLDLEDPGPGTIELLDASGLSKLFLNLSPALPSILQGEDEGLSSEALTVGLHLLAPTVGYTHSTSDCLGHNGSLETCYSKIDPYLEFPYDPTFLVWDLSDKDNCAAGVNCIDPADPYPYVLPGQFGYNVYLPPYADPIASMDGLDHTVYLPPPSLGQCGKTLKYYVTTYYVPEGTQLMAESTGGWVTVPGTCANDDYVALKLTLESVKFWDIHEEPGEGDTIEVFGNFFVIGDLIDTLKVFKLAGGWNADFPADFCPPPDFGVALDNAGPYWGICPVRVFGGFDYPMASLWLTKESGSFGYLNSGPGDNSVQFTLVKPGHVDVWVGLVDHDAVSGDDIACQANLSLQNSLANWSTLNGKHYFMTQGSNGTAGCSVKFELTALDYHEAP